MISEFSIVASRLIHERFGQSLGKELPSLGLLHYHEALFDSYRKYRTHSWSEALRFSLGALLHKHRSFVKRVDDYLSGTVKNPSAILALLEHEINIALYPPASAEALKSVKDLPRNLAELLKKDLISEAAEAAGRGYASIDALRPAMFEFETARRITDRLVQPKGLIIRGAMSWSKWSMGDTDKKRVADKHLAELLKKYPDLVKAFGQPYNEEEPDNYWKWWEFAVFDGMRWHSFHLDDRFALSLESWSVGEEGGKNRERVAELILAEFKRAASLQMVS